MEALLLSAYDAGSHARWRRGLTSRTPTIAWRQLTLPPRHFAWRRRSNSMTWGFGPAREVLEAPADLLLATSVTDLSALRGFVPALARLPTIVYFHENQFAYPFRDEARRNALSMRIQDLYTALAADAALFNSAHNRDTTLEGARALLTAMPDGVPEDLLARLEERARVIPVGIDDALFERARSPRDERIHIVWNHRWEYDKAPGRLFEALEVLVARGLGDRFRLHVVGQRFRRHPEAFDRAREALADQIETWGYLDSRQDYEALLSRADLVASTALHEFQGLAALEAMACGCRALTPDRLAYPEYVPDTWRYPSTPEDSGAEARAIAGHIEALLRDTSWRARSADAARAHARDYQWDRVTPRYLELFDTLTHAHPPHEESRR